jgi:hypothetical protein
MPISVSMFYPLFPTWPNHCNLFTSESCNKFWIPVLCLSHVIKGLSIAFIQWKFQAPYLGFWYFSLMVFRELKSSIMTLYLCPFYQVATEVFMLSQLLIGINDNGKYKANSTLVTAMILYNDWLFGHYPSSYYYLKQYKIKSLLCWAQLLGLVTISRWQKLLETESSVQNIILNKNRMMDNIQKVRHLNT